MLCTGATFVTKNSCLVSRIVSFDTVKSWNSIFLNLRIFSFNSYVYYLTRGFIASTRAFNLATRAFSLLTRGFKLVTPKLEIVTRGYELVTHNSCFTFPHATLPKILFKVKPQARLYSLQLNQNGTFPTHFFSGNV